MIKTKSVGKRHNFTTNTRTIAAENKSQKCIDNCTYILRANIRNNNSNSTTQTYKFNGISLYIHHNEHLLTARIPQDHPSTTKKINGHFKASRVVGNYNNCPIPAFRIFHSLKISQHMLLSVKIYQIVNLMVKTLIKCHKYKYCISSLL